MPSGLIALLDDISMIAKLASASADDIGLAVNAGTYRVYRSEQLQGGPTATAAAA